MFPINSNITKVSRCCISSGKRRYFLISSIRSLLLLPLKQQQQHEIVIQNQNKSLHTLTQSYGNYRSVVNNNDNYIKRYLSSNNKKDNTKKDKSKNQKEDQKNSKILEKERKQIYRALHKMKLQKHNKNIVFDEEDYIEPTFENGFGYVIRRPPRLGYEDGLYGVGSFGCSYDRHEEDPKNDNPDVYEIQILIEQRVECKLVQDYDMADTIEEELQVLHGVYLDDQEKKWTTNPELVTKTRLRLLKEKERQNQKESTPEDK